MSPLVNESVVDRFEKSWFDNKPLSISSCVEGLPDDEYLATLEELICVELEFSWKRWSNLVATGDTVAGLMQPKTLASYLDAFPRIEKVEVIKRIVKEEVISREKAGQSINMSDSTREQPQVDRGSDVIHNQASPDEVPGGSGQQKGGAGNVPPDDVFAMNPVDQYTLLAKLGEGGMGIVYKAYDEKIKRFVAVKMLKNLVQANQKLAKRLRVEAKAIAQLNHRNVIKLYDIGTSQQGPYIVMQLAEGGTLRERIDDSVWPPLRSAAFIEKLARAVQYMHQQGIVHRDIKPGNILFDEHDEPLLTDFGLAKSNDSGSQLTGTGEIFGTLCYMAPEQMSSSDSSSEPRADVYALGAVLYELLVGRPPFKGSTPAETMKQVISTDVVSPRLLQNKLPRDLNTICLKCLQRTPEKRYASAAELADDLEAFSKKLPIAARPIHPVVRGFNWARRKPYQAITLVLLLVLLIAIPLVQWIYYVAANESAVALRQKNAELAADQIKLESANATVKYAEYIATVNLVDQDLRMLNFLSAKERIERFNKSITKGMVDPRNIEWKRLQNAVDGSFIQLHEPGSVGVTSFDMAESADLLLYNAAYGSGPHQNMLRIYDLNDRQYLNDEPLLVPGEDVPSQDGPVIQWIGGRTFVIGNGTGLYSITIGEGINETTADDIIELLKGEVQAVVRSGQPGEFFVVSSSPGEGASNEMCLQAWKQVGDEISASGEAVSLAGGENADEPVTDIAIAPGGKYLAVARGKSVELRDPGTGALLCSKEAAKRRASKFDSLIKSVTFVDATQPPLLAIAGHNRAIELFEISADGSSMVQYRELTGHESAVQSLSYEHESGWLISGSNDQTVFCWSPLSGERNFVLDEHKREVLKTSFCGKGRYLLSASIDKSLIIRDRGPGAIRLAVHRELTATEPRNVIAVTGTSQVIITGSVDPNDKDSKGFVALLDRERSDSLEFLQVDRPPRKGTLHPSKQYALLPLTNGTLVRIEIGEKELSQSIVPITMPDTLEPFGIERVTMVVHNSRLDRFYIGLEMKNGGAVARLDADGENAVILNTTLFEKPIFCLAISPSGRMLAAGTNGVLDGYRPMVHFYRTEDQEEYLERRQTSRRSMIHGMCFHPDGHSLYVAGDGNDIEQLSIPGEEERGSDQAATPADGSLSAHHGTVLRLETFGSDMRLISFGKDGLLCFWELKSGQLLTKRELAGRRMYDMAYDPEEHTLLLLIDDQVTSISLD